MYRFLQNNPLHTQRKISSKISSRHPEFSRKLRNSPNLWNLLSFWILWRFQWNSHKKFIYVNAKLGKSVTLYHKLAKRMFTRGFFVVQTLFVWRDTKRMRIELGPHGGKHFKMVSSRVYIFCVQEEITGKQKSIIQCGNNQCIWSSKQDATNCHGCWWAEHWRATNGESDIREG